VSVNTYMAHRTLFKQEADYHLTIIAVILFFPLRPLSARIEIYYAFSCNECLLLAVFSMMSCTSTDTVLSEEMEILRVTQNRAKQKCSHQSFGSVNDNHGSHCNLNEFFVIYEENIILISSFDSCILTDSLSLSLSLSLSRSIYLSIFLSFQELI